MTDSPTSSIETLKARFEDLKSKKITAEANLKNANATLEELRREARTQFGTDDLDELRQKLSDMEAENERLRSEYETHLDQIEHGLAQVESQYRRESEQ
jgi:CCR4-NOT transcriptional regulation complex NOT5 subunit